MQYLFFKHALGNKIFLLHLRLFMRYVNVQIPRFASSILVQESASQIGQDIIVEYLLRYSNVIELASRINDVRELHGSEIITCIQKGSKYVVLEGNRRTCACKLLLDRTLIPEQYKSKIKFITERTKANITKVMVTIYPDRESVQPYLSDRHITGVKKWSALEKNNYYMNLFYQYKDVEEVKNILVIALLSSQKAS